MWGTYDYMKDVGSYLALIFILVLVVFTIVGSLFVLSDGLVLVFFNSGKLILFKGLKKLKLKTFKKILLKKIIFIEKQ